jgi:hypothetical protein
MENEYIHGNQTVEKPTLLECHEVAGENSTYTTTITPPPSPGWLVYRESIDCGKQHAVLAYKRTPTGYHETEIRQRATKRVPYDHNQHGRKHTNFTTEHPYMMNERGSRDTWQYLQVCQASRKRHPTSIEAELCKSVFPMTKLGFPQPLDLDCFVRVRAAVLNILMSVGIAGGNLFVGALNALRTASGIL